LGNGHFDGANLVNNFEQLDPGNTYWSKLYSLYANIDHEKPVIWNLNAGGVVISC